MFTFLNLYIDFDPAPVRNTIHLQVGELGKDTLTLGDKAAIVYVVAMLRNQYPREFAEGLLKGMKDNYALLPQHEKAPQVPTPRKERVKVSSGELNGNP